MLVEAGVPAGFLVLTSRWGLVQGELVKGSFQRLPLGDQSLGRACLEGFSCPSPLCVYSVVEPV